MLVMVSALTSTSCVQLRKPRFCRAFRSSWQLEVVSTQRNTTMTVHSTLLRKEGMVVVLGPIYTGKSDFSTMAQASKVLGSRGSAIVDLSFPCSDPLAGYQVIQAAATHSLGRSTKFVAIKFMLKEVVMQSSSAIALFSHYNQILKLAFEKFKALINDAGNCGQRPLRAYDVFISYKRDDMLHPVSHLKSALEQKEIIVFIDFTLDRGVDFWPATIEAIEQSDIAVVVISQSFHSSPWCLNELVKILECRKKWGLTVLPIFWGIDARELREQSRPFVEMIGRGEKGLKQKQHHVQMWRDALRTVGMISGWSVSNSSDKTEAEVIQDLTGKISAKLNRSV